MNIDNFACARDPRYDLVDAIKAVDEEYYFIGDDNHRYAYCCITKELGDLILKKCPGFVQGGMRMESVRCFDLEQTDLSKGPVDLEGLWDEYFQFDEIAYEKGYQTFEDFKKGEGFE